MKQETWMLPVRCQGCRRVFDLWRDLQQEQEEQKRGVFPEDAEMHKFLKQNFCVHCRKAVSGVLNSEETAEAEGQNLEVSIEME